MVINLRDCEGHTLAAGFPGNWWANLTSISPINGCLPLRWVVKMVAAACLRYTVGVSFQDFLLQTCKISPVQQTVDVSVAVPRLFGFRLGNHKACRPVGCSPTLGNNAREGIGTKKQDWTGGASRLWCESDKASASPRQEKSYIGYK